MRTLIKNVCLLTVSLFISQLAPCQSNKEWFLGKWTNGDNTIVLTKTTFVDSEGDVYPVKYDYSPESGYSIDFLDTDSNEYTGSGGELLGYDVTLDDKNQVIILSEAWHLAWKEQYSKKIPENVNAEFNSSQEKAQQLVFEFALEEGDKRIDANEMPSAIDEFKEAIQEDFGMSITNVSIEESPAGYIFSVTFEKELKYIPDHCFKYAPLIKIQLPEGIEHIGDAAFAHCDLLKVIVIPNSVTTIGESAFQECSSLTSITLPNSVTTIGESAFQECSSLTSITLPNSVTTIGEGVFWDCTCLTHVVIPNSVTTIKGSAFHGCTNLSEIILSSDNPFFTFDGSFLLNKSGDLLISSSKKNKIVVIPSSVTTIGDNAFSGYTSLTHIEIPNSVTTIGNGAFQNCSSLTSITLPNSVTTIGIAAFPETTQIIRK